MPTMSSFQPAGRPRAGSRDTHSTQVTVNVAHPGSASGGEGSVRIELNTVHGSQLRSPSARDATPARPAADAVGAAVALARRDDSHLFRTPVTFGDNIRGEEVTAELDVSLRNLETMRQRLRWAAYGLGTLTALLGGVAIATTIDTQQDFIDDHGSSPYVAGITGFLAFCSGLGTWTLHRDTREPVGTRWHDAPVRRT